MDMRSDNHYHRIGMRHGQSHSRLMTQDDLFLQGNDPVSVARRNPHLMSTEFLEWLPENLHIWVAFEREAFKIIARGISHYSSYTIVEFLRHHTAVSEVNSEFKINNNVRPYLSRLFDKIHPAYAGLFEYRATTKKKGEKNEF